MAQNKINDLRNHLFETIEMLKDGDDKETGMTVAKANSISKVAQTIINSAKLELEYIKVQDNLQGTPTVVTDFLLGEKKEE